MSKSLLWVQILAFWVVWTPSSKASDSELRGPVSYVQDMTKDMWTGMLNHKTNAQNLSGVGILISVPGPIIYCHCTLHFLLDWWFYLHDLFIFLHLHYRYSSIQYDKAVLRSEDDLDLLRVPLTSTRQEPDKV